MKIRSIPGFNGYYASDRGEIVSILRGRPTVLRSSLVGGYRRVVLYRRGQRNSLLVHRLVLMAFRGLPPYGLVAAHLDGTRDNNRLNNLRWVTFAENMGHKKIHGTVNARAGEKHPAAKLTARNVKSIRALRAGGLLQREIAKQFGVSQVQIGNICRRASWIGVR